MPLNMGLALLSERASFAEGWSCILAQSVKPERADLCYVDKTVALIFFDFDGTLTKTPGEHATRKTKIEELEERKDMLKPRLQKLHDSGITLGIMSKSTENTVVGALEQVGLLHLFNGPKIFKAVGLEGKAGIIQDLCSDSEALPQLQEDGLYRILLVDDDVYECERARDRGIQTFAAPATGGMQEEDFAAIFIGMGLEALPTEHISNKTAVEPQDASFPRHELLVRVWTAGLIGVSLGLDNKQTQHVNNDTGVGALSSFYDINEEVGRGGFAVIASGRHIQTDQNCALKCVLKKDAGKHYYQNFVERDCCNFILRLSREAPHPNIVHYFDYFESNDYLFGALELLTGRDLSLFLQEYAPITHVVAKHLTMQALSALAHFHSALGVGLIHRDVKLENLRFRTMSEDAELVLIDVGLAVPANLDEEKQVVGTLLYTAPEVFSGFYTTQVDIWSYGVVCYIMLTGKPPWIQDRRTFKDRKIIDEDRVKRALKAPEVKKLKADANDFLESLLTLDARLRLTAKEALEHPWLKEPKLQRLNSVSLEDMNKEDGERIEASPTAYTISAKLSRKGSYRRTY